MLGESWHGYCRLRTSCTIHQHMSCNSSLANMFKQSNFEVLLTDWSKMGPKGPSQNGKADIFQKGILGCRGTAPRLRGPDFQSRGHIGLEGRWTFPIQGAPRHQKKTPSNRVVTCLYMVSIGVHYMSSRNFLYVRHGKFTCPSMDTM